MAKPYKAIIPTSPIRSARSFPKGTSPNRVFSLAKPSSTTVNNNIVRLKQDVDNSDEFVKGLNKSENATIALINTSINNGAINSVTGKIVDDIGVEVIDYGIDRGIKRNISSVSFSGSQRKPNITNTKLSSQTIIDDNAYFYLELTYADPSYRRIYRFPPNTPSFFAFTEYDPLPTGVILPQRDQCPPVSPYPGSIGIDYIYDPILGWIPINR